ncbi:MAG: cysteine--tRNA ligase [Acidimicrobiales bacterium]
MLRLHDSASQRLELLVPRSDGRASMYVCGPTVYERPHLGHGRMVLVFDMLRRYLCFSGLDVLHVSNITDVDDKIVKRAASENRSIVEVAAQFEASWWTATDAIGALRPHLAPHATDYIAGMLALIGELVSRHFAYETSSGVYLAVERVDGYGLLAHQSLDSLKAGARVEIDEEKRSPLDFALWKRTRPREPSWGSRFGQGRPGWHTECVVMSLDALGEDFDIHAGSEELAFPHHENERAQASALDKRFARRWVHCGWVVVGDEKMSKSLSNFTTIDDLCTRHDPRCYRLLILQSHYRSQIEVSELALSDAERALARLDRLVTRFSVESPEDLASKPVGQHVRGDRRIDDSEVQRFKDRMDDDLDTPGALAGIFEMVSRANSVGDSGDGQGATRLARTVSLLCSVLGLQLRPSRPGDVDQSVHDLLAQREHARAQRDYERADEIRQKLARLGWTLEDSAEGTKIRRSG